MSNVTVTVLDNANLSIEAPDAEVVEGGSSPDCITFGPGNQVGLGYVKVNPETPGQFVLPILDECGVEVRTPDGYDTEPDAPIYLLPHQDDNPDPEKVAAQVRASIAAAVEWLENQHRH